MSNTQSARALRGMPACQADPACAAAVAWSFAPKSFGAGFYPAPKDCDVPTAKGGWDICDGLYFCFLLNLVGSIVKIA